MKPGHQQPDNGEFLTRVRNRTLHALPSVLRSRWLSLQAEPSGGVATEQNFSQRSTVHMVARWAL